MCGIFFSCSQEKHRPPSNALLDDLKRRGPDGIDSILTSVTLETIAPQNIGLRMHDRTCFLSLISTVLSLRGSSVVRQPLRDVESGSVLCWNGEAWKIGSQLIHGNDAEQVFDILLDATKRHSDHVNDMLASRNTSLQDVVDALSSITGPYAFVFYDAQHHRVFYGRDVLGRRSLLIRRLSTTGIELSSVCDPTGSKDWMEVEADGIYVLDLTADANLSDDVDRVTHVPWVVDCSRSGLPFTLVPQTPLLLRCLRIDTC